MQEFIETNHKKVRINDKIQAKLEKHYAITKSLFGHYAIERELSNPLIEYARYVLSHGNEGEKTAFANGIVTKISIKNGVLGFV